MNYKYFSNIVLSEELINEILKQKNLNYEIIKGTLCYIESFEKVLIIINKNIEIIFECLKKEGKKLKLSEFDKTKMADNIKIGSEIVKILKYQSDKKDEFIIFEKDFLKNYIKINNKVEDKDCPLPAINQNEKDIKYNENIKTNQMDEIMEEKNNDFKGETKKGKNLLIFEQEKNKKRDKLENISKRTEEENINDIIQKGRNNTHEKEKKEDEKKIEKKRTIKINNIKENNQEQENKKIKKLK